MNSPLVIAIFFLALGAHLSFSDSRADDGGGASYDFSNLDCRTLMESNIDADLLAIVEKFKYGRIRQDRPPVSYLASPGSSCGPVSILNAAEKFFHFAGISGNLPLRRNVFTDFAYNRVPRYGARFTPKGISLPDLAIVSRRYLEEEIPEFKFRSTTFDIEFRAQNSRKLLPSDLSKANSQDSIVFLEIVSQRVQFPEGERDTSFNEDRHFVVLGAYDGVSGRALLIDSIVNGARDFVNLIPVNVPVWKADTFEVLTNSPIDQEWEVLISGAVIIHAEPNKKSTRAQLSN